MTHDPSDTPSSHGDTAEPENDTPTGERIAKVLARAGVGSRRDIERMIEAGRVEVNGEMLTTPAVLIRSLAGVKVDGAPVAEGGETRVWRLNKRRGTLTTHRDPEGRPTVFDRLPDRIGRVISVGRLDMNTEGLLLLTNDGALARWMELPSTALWRRYRVRVHGRVDESALHALKDGATIDGTHYGEVEASLERTQGTNNWLKVAIREGKNREVRKLMEHLGLTVSRLIRTHYGPFTLNKLADGSVEEVPMKQLYAALGNYFTDAPTTIAAPNRDIDTRKWAKAKPKNKVKPGYKKRQQAEGKSDERKDKRHTGPQKPAPHKGTGPKDPDQKRETGRKSTAPKTGSLKTVHQRPKQPKKP